MEPSTQPTQSSSPIPGDEQVDMACASLLCTLLKYDIGDWMHSLPQEQLATLSQRLLSEANLLNHNHNSTNHLSSSYTLPTALLSVSLLSLIQWRHSVEHRDFTQMIHTTNLVENVLAFSFSSTTTTSTSTTQPMWWTHDSQLAPWRSYGQELVHCWSICGGHAWSMVSNAGRFWRPYLESFWNHILSSGSSQEKSISCSLLPSVWLWHTMSRMTARGTLFSVIHRRMGSDDDMAAPCRRIFEYLIQCCRQSSVSIQVPAASLLRDLLSDRQSPSTHDDLSRALWSALDDNVLDGILEMTLDCASTEDIHQPILLSFLNILDLQLMSQSLTKAVMSKLGAESVEKLIHIIKPKQIRIDFLDTQVETQDGLDSDTPPAHNLSRLDEKSILVEHEDEKDPRGLDNAVRLSSASVLGRLGYCPLDTSEEGVRLLQSRICTAVNDFMATFQQTMDDEPSLDLTKRLLRLQMVVATPENEEFMASIMYTNEAMRHKGILQQRQEQASYQKKLEEALTREHQLQEENRNLVRQQSSQSLVFRREMSRLQKNATQDARQLVAIHAAERTKAESRASEFSRRAKEAESRLAEAEALARASHDAAASATEELERAKMRASELEEDSLVLRQQCGEEIAKSTEIAEELEARNEELGSMERRSSELEQEIHARDEETSQVQEINGKLQDNLEDLFADMVSLTQIYQVKEKEEATTKETADGAMQEITNKLNSERKKNEELAEREHTLLQENEKLFKKLTKYKERLVEERRERQEQTDRRKKQNPVSYINQLHQSGTFTEKSTRTERTPRESIRSGVLGKSGTFTEKSTRTEKTPRESVRSGIPGKSSSRTSSSVRRDNKENSYSTSASSSARIVYR